MMYESIVIFSLVLMRNWSYKTANLILITLPLQSDLCGNGIDSVLYRIHPIYMHQLLKAIQKELVPHFWIGSQQPAYLFCLVHCCNFVIHG